MKTKEGEIFSSLLNGEHYTIKKIVNSMVVLESNDGKKQILTGVDTLESFYRKKEEAAT
jgi:hypothetical protein